MYPTQRSKYPRHESRSRETISSFPLFQDCKQGRANKTTYTNFSQESLRLYMIYKHIYMLYTSHTSTPTIPVLSPPRTYFTRSTTRMETSHTKPSSKLTIINITISSRLQCRDYPYDRALGFPLLSDPWRTLVRAGCTDLVSSRSDRAYVFCGGGDVITFYSHIKNACPTRWKTIRPWYEPPDHNNFLNIQN